jgi:hypothetical protein
MHSWGQDVGFNTYSAVTNYTSDSQYELSGIVQAGGNVSGARQYWNQYIPSSGSQGYFMVGAGKVADVFCLNEQGNGGYHSLLTTSLILDNNTQNYPAGFTSQNVRNCGVSGYATTLFDEPGLFTQTASAANPGGNTFTLSVPNGGTTATTAITIASRVNAPNCGAFAPVNITSAQAAVMGPATTQVSLSAGTATINILLGTANATGSAVTFVGTCTP